MVPYVKTACSTEMSWPRLCLTKDSQLWRDGMGGLKRLQMLLYQTEPNLKEKEVF